MITGPSFTKSGFKNKINKHIRRNTDSSFLASKKK